MKKIALLLMFLSSISFASTLKELRDDVRYNILDTTTTSHNPRYSDTFLNYRLNQTAREISRITYPIYTSKLINAVTGQMEYTVSTDTAKIDKVVFLQVVTTTDSYKKLTYSTIQSLDTDIGTTWEQTNAGLPRNYYIKGNSIGLVPKPSGTYANTNAIKVYYYQSPRDMSADTDEPWNGQYNLVDYQYLIVLGTVIKCKKDKGQDISIDLADYNAGLSRMVADMSAIRPDSSVINVTK